MNGRAAAIVEERGVKGKEVRTGSKRKLSQKRLRQIEALILEHRESGRKLSRSILRRWRVRMSIEEVDSIVDLTLCEAAHRYEPTRGASFMTFFYYHLRGHLVRAVAAAANANQVFLSFARSSGLDAPDWTITNEENSYSAVPEFAIFGQRDTEGPEQVLLRKEKIDSCRSACGQLDDLEQEVLFRSFSDEQALIDIAKELGYSRCHISRVKRRALERLKGFLDSMPASEIPAVKEEAESPAFVARVTAAIRQSGKRRARRNRNGLKIAPRRPIRTAA